MGAKQYFEFKGVKYGVGTIIKYPITDCRWAEPKTMLVKFCGGGHFVYVHGQGVVQLYSDFFNGTSTQYHKRYINYIEIIEPVYYQEPAPPKKQNIFFRTGSGSWEAHNQVVCGFIIYIVVMVLALFLKSPGPIWVLATIIYFAWKAKK